MWVIPPEQNAAFVYRMEDVLSVYQRPYDPTRPVVCMDEISKQLLDDVRTPLPCLPGKPARYDGEYRRQGVANLFLFSEPLIGRRQVKVTAQRCQRDWAEALREVMDTTYREAERIVLVMDNLNTHSPASFYATFPPEEAKRLTDRLEIHYTPKHGSWLNMAEIELSILQRQCLDRRLATMPCFDREATTWANQRNQTATKIHWQFTTQDARIKLKQLYPSPQL